MLLKVKGMDWASRHCTSLKKGAKPESKAEVVRFLKKIPGWHLSKGEICKTFTFRNYTGTLAFVRAAARIAQRENHHPEIKFGYDTCRIRYSTHTVGGISENDFICAAKINLLEKKRRSA